MATHFLARPVGDTNYPAPVEQFTTHGSREVLVNPRTTNSTDRDIEGVALLNIAGRQHTVALTHLHEASEPENPNMVAYSYFLSTPSSGYSAEVRNIYKYLNNQYNKQSTYIYYDQDIMISDVDFSKSSSLGNWSPIGSPDGFTNSFIIDFRTYILFLTEQGTIPQDIFENQVPYEVDIPPRPTWITSINIRYIIDWTTSGDSGSESYDNFNSFILAKQRYANNRSSYTSLSWKIRIYFSANINDGLGIRGPETITINPVNIPSNIPKDPIYEIKKPKLLYINLVQEAGYNKLTIVSHDAVKANVGGVDYFEAFVDGSFGYWDVNLNKYISRDPDVLNPAYHDLLSNNINTVKTRYTSDNNIAFGDFRLRDGEKLGIITLEFHNGTNYDNSGCLDFETGSEWFYIGKPFFLGVKSDTPTETKLVWAINCGDQSDNQNLFCRPHFSHRGLKSTHWNVYGNPEEGEVKHPWLWQGLDGESNEAEWCQVIMFPIWGKYNYNGEIYNPSETPTGPHDTLTRYLVNWIDKAYGMAKITMGDGGTDPRYAGAISSRDDIRKDNMAFRDSKTPTESAPNRLMGTGQSFAQIWEQATRGNYHFSEVLMVPILVTPRKLLRSDPVYTAPGIGQDLCIAKVNLSSTFKDGISNLADLPDYIGFNCSIIYDD